MKSIRNLVLFCQLVLKKNQILLLIKGCNSVANLRKTKINNTNVDLVNDNAQGQLTLQSTVRSGQISNSSKTMVVLLTCKNEEDPIKNRGARVFTTLYIKFSGVQGQITLVFVVVSGRNSNPSILSCMSSLPARMRLIKSEMKALECSQSFSHYKSMGIFPDAQGQLTPQSLVRSGRISISF